MLSPIARSISPSGIRKVFSILLQKMKDAISLGVGEPDFEHRGIFEKQESIHWKRTEHTILPNWGLVELRKEIAKLFR